MYSEFISEVDLFHKQKLAQSTNYAKTCCVYKGEINLTLLREEPESIFFSVNLDLDFSFLQEISHVMAGCYGQEDTTVVAHCTGLAPPPHRSFLTEAES